MVHRKLTKRITIETVCVQYEKKTKKSILTYVYHVTIIFAIFKNPNYEWAKIED